jgi:HEXXH motif-containing protein
MASEISSLLRWVVPMAEGDSFFVPAFRGLVALPVSREITLAFNVVHELSHNIMSCIYDLVDILGNPDDRVRSPFSREVEPLSSVIHSCWAFSHELRTVRALAVADLLDSGTDWDRVLLKIRIFYDRALPVIREHARLSPFGRALLEHVESIVYAA